MIRGIEREAACFLSSYRCDCRWALWSWAIRIRQKLWQHGKTITGFDCATYPGAPSSFVTFQLALTKPTGWLSLLLSRKLFPQGCRCWQHSEWSSFVYCVAQERPSWQASSIPKAGSKWKHLWGLLLARRMASSQSQASYRANKYICQGKEYSANGCKGGKTQRSSLMLLNFILNKGGCYQCSRHWGWEHNIIGSCS